MKTSKTFTILAAVLMLASCYRFDPHEAHYTDGPIWPDYADVTIPAGIAPLNFCYTGEHGKTPVTTFTCEDLQISIKGSEVVWKEKDWKRMMAKAAGKDIQVSSSVLDEDWTMHVSTDPMDEGLVYRLLAPGYEVFSKMGIYQRETFSYRQSAIIENTMFDGCVNCHAFNRGDASNYSLHIRGDHGATLLNIDGRMEAYNTKTDETLGFCVYPYWHPSGNYIAYSTNNTRQSFHVMKEKLIEVFDLASDMQIYDISKNQVITAPQIKLDDIWETFPAFSADGRSLYFCGAKARPIPAELDQIRYNLYRVDFDPETGNIGKDVELVVDAESMGKSISFPKPSYDGNFLVYTLSDYGNFSIWHHEADLWMLDLRTGGCRPMDKVNSPDTESYHSWSSNSRWMVLSSRRDDGLYTRLYITHIDENGNESKPFMLPQEHPLHFYATLGLSYNVPEFVTSAVSMDKVEARKKINSPQRIPFGFRWSE